MDQNGPFWPGGGPFRSASSTLAIPEDGSGYNFHDRNRFRGILRRHVMIVSPMVVQAVRTVSTHSGL